MYKSTSIFCKLFLVIFALISFFSLGINNAQASTRVTLNPVADARVTSASPTTNYGTVNTFAAAFYSSGNNRYQSMIKFDLSSIPANSVIDRAYVNLTATSSPCEGTPEYLGLANAQNNWTETGVNWNNKPTFSAVMRYNTSSGWNFNCSGGNYTQLDLTFFVRDWANNTFPNYGLVLLGPDGTEGASTWNRTFHSRESSTSSARPQLVVDYSPAPDTTAPSISAAAVDQVTSNSAKIAWITSEASIKTVEWGTVKGTYNLSASDNNSYATSFNQQVSNLSPGTTYYFRFKTKDAAGNEAYHAKDNYFFTTAASPGGTGTSGVSGNTSSGSTPAPKTVSTNSNSKPTIGSPSPTITPSVILATPGGEKTNAPKPQNTKSQSDNSNFVSQIILSALALLAVITLLLFLLRKRFTFISQKKVALIIILSAFALIGVVSYLYSINFFPGLTASSILKMNGFDLLKLKK